MVGDGGGWGFEPGGHVIHSGKEFDEGGGPDGSSEERGDEESDEDAAAGFCGQGQKVKRAMPSSGPR